MAIPMTKAGYINLQDQLDRLREQIPDMQKAISEAREKGDLKENAEYHAARESLGMHEAKIAEIESRLGQAQIISSKNMNSDEILFGATVSVLDIEIDDEEEYTLVGEGESDPMNNKILTTSPMGQAMLNKKVGDHFTVSAPGGDMEYKVLKISYEA
ncbi:MAG: transcription elongation factor GreA [Planctomycetes bacterium]|nr:transcription elongation factor GreA [Planctomycetota bacterium]